MERDPLNPAPDHELRAIEDRVRHALRTAGSATSGRPGPACPAHATLAAFVDGRLRPDDRTAVEVHLADCPDCLAACRLAAAVAADDRAGRLAAPAAAVARATAIVPPPVSPWRRLAFDAWPLLGRAAFAAAACLAICVAGYRVGRATCADAAGPADRLLTEMTFGVMGDESSDDPFLDTFAIATEASS